MQLVTFLGTNEYADVEYCWNGRRCRSRFVAEALAELLPADSVLVGLTEGAKAHKNWFDLRAALGSRAGMPVDLPDGRTEDEQWTIFTKLAERVESGSKLVIDITHSFRSMGVLAVVLASYLREARGVEVVDIVYGAFEKGQSEAPLISLAPFLEMIEWVAAARFLSVSGDSRMLAELLQRKTPDGRAPKHGKKVSLLGCRLRQTSQALATNRAKQVADCATVTLQALDALPKALKPALAPFPVIRESVRRTYEPLREGGLEGALRLVEWYVERGRYLQAVTLASEWLISYTGARTGNPAEEREDREWISGSLSAEARRRSGQTDGALKRDYMDRSAEEAAGVKAKGGSGNRDYIDLSASVYDQLLNAWMRIAGLRNDMAHCGYRAGAWPAETIVKEAQEIPQTLRGLASQAGEEGAP